MPPPRSNKSLSTASTALGNASSHHNNNGTISSSMSPKTKNSSLWMGRVLYSLCLLGVAALLGFFAFYFVHSSQQNLAEHQFESIAERALKSVERIAARKQSGTKTMANVVAQAVPDAAVYPFVTVPGFESMATSVMETASIRECGFCPLVEESQREAFETFAYEYFGKRFPDQNDTALSSFGQGVWNTNPETGERYHEVGGATDPSISNRTFLTPILQHDKGAHPALMLNIRGAPARARQIEDMMRCADVRSQSGNLSMPCGAITDIVNLRGQPEGTGPGAVIIEPIHPASQPDQVTAILASTIVWDEILEDVFADSVSGIDCVLETTEGTVYSYSVQGGIATPVGWQDRHDPQYDHFQRSATINANQYTRNSPTYTLHLYPNDGFYQTYNSVNPIYATLLVVGVMVFTSLSFLVYDWNVRKEFSSKKELLEARRRFVRFISHEVRTPLNSVCMGLSLMQEKHAQKAGFKRAELLTKFLEKQQQQPEQPAPEAPKQSALFSTSVSSLNAPLIPPALFSTTSTSSITPPPPALFATTSAPSISSSQPPQPALFATSSTSSLNQPALFSTSPFKAPSPSKAPRSKPKPDPVTLEEFSLLSDLLSNAQSSVEVLNDFLNFDKIESGKLKLDLQVVNIRALIESTAKEFNLSANKKRIDYNVVYENNQSDDVEENVPSGLALIGDDVRIQQVLRNLISNAIKFTDGKGRVDVRVKYQPPPYKPRQDTFELKDGETDEFTFGGNMTIEVQDSGAGLSKQQLTKLFSEHIQFNPNDLQAGKGTGLGLFISKGIVDQHRGTLVATSEGLGSGSTFVMTLPLYRANVDSGFETSESTSSHQDPMTERKSNQLMDESNRSASTSHRILIVDDAMMNRKMMSRLLTHHGHVCELAEDGEVAVRMVLEATENGEAYDTILMDYEMPVLNGPDATARIRTKGFDTFIVGVTGNMFPEDTEKFLTSGANAVLPKPFKMEALDSLWAEYCFRDELIDG